MIAAARSLLARLDAWTRARHARSTAVYLAVQAFGEDVRKVGSDE